MGEVKQLAIDFDNDEIVEEDIKKDEENKTIKAAPVKCKHCVKIKSFKSDYISFCSKCGKILSLRHKKGEK